MHLFVVTGFLVAAIGWNGEVFKGLEKAQGTSHTPSTVDRAVGYVDDLDESGRTLAFGF